MVTAGRDESRPYADARTIPAIPCHANPCRSVQARFSTARMVNGGASCSNILSHKVAFGVRCIEKEKTMSDFLSRYQEGRCEEVWEEIVALGEAIF